MNLCEISDKINDKMDVDVQGRQSIPKSGGGGGTDSKLGRSGGMLPEICFLI